MRTLPLGDTGAQVSALCLGTMHFGTKNDEPASQRLLDQYVEAGGTFLDTANIYAAWVPGGAGGESEALLGRWMRQRKNRASLFLASKVGFEYRGVERGLRAAQIETECDKSLSRLGVEALDLYYAHVDDPVTPLEESLEAFARLVRAGKVRYLGLSNYRAWRVGEVRALTERRGWPQPCCIQQRHTYARPKPGASFGPQVSSNDDLLDYCRKRPITLLAYSPLLSGAYVRADRPPGPQYQSADTEARRAALAQVARETGATVNQVILAWMLASFPVALPVIGASSPAQLSENLAALNLSLTPQQQAALDAAGA